MTPEELRSLIDKELEEDADFEGMALYTSMEALTTKGRFYVLGFNPADKGGNYSRLRDEKFKSAD